jgi:hypothetical protein
MSLSKPVERTVNPAKKFYKWRGEIDKGYVTYYDKELKKDIIVKDFRFMVLDADLFCITGYDQTSQGAYISNEVKAMDDLIIINFWKDKKKSEFKRGTYEQLKELVKSSRDLKYTKSIYIMTPDGELGNLHLAGAPLTSWFNDITTSEMISSNWIIIKEIKEGKNGAVKYKSPVWGFGDKVDKASYDKAVSMDAKVLQPYLEAYLIRNGSSLSKSETTHDDGDFSQEVPEFDSKEWRKYDHPISKKALCHYHRGELIDIKLGLEQDGDTENDFYNCVCQALFEYQQAEKIWKDKKIRDGRALKELALDELKEMLGKMDVQAPEHEAKLSIECAIEAKQAEIIPASEEEDDADIPF